MTNEGGRVIAATARTAEVRTLNPRGTELFHTSYRQSLLVTVGLLVVACAVAGPTPAMAMRAATGEPLFYPCTSCHPVVRGEAGRTLPNGFKRHQIVLAEHAMLGEGSKTCAVCHDDAAKNPGKLKTIDGTLVDISGDVSKVCYRCHSAIYKEWKSDMHGAGMDKCTSAGCHDPHTPGVIFGTYLLPFAGNGFQAQVLPENQPFTPFASPPGLPPVETPHWLIALTSAGVVIAGGITTTLVRGRSKR